MKRAIAILFLAFAGNEAAAEKLVGDPAEKIISEGNTLYVSGAPNDSGYRVLTVYEGRIFECTVAVIETVGFEQLAVICIGRGND